MITSDLKPAPIPLQSLTSNEIAEQIVQTVKVCDILQEKKKIKVIYFLINIQLL